MRNKKCLSFMLIVVFLVSAMLCNVQASSGGYWTCTYSYYSPYSVGSTIDSATGLSLSAGLNTAVCKFDSSFEVKAGDTVYLDFNTLFTGTGNYDEASSANWAKIIAEDGTVLLSANYTLYGNNIADGSYSSKKITSQTAGKLTFEVGLEGTGARNVAAEIDYLYVEVNSDEV